jgi:hypothetical protein
VKTRWLDRRIAAPGPYLALCLCEEEFKTALASLKSKAWPAWIKNPHSDATTNLLVNEDGKTCAVVCIRGWEGRDPIEVAGLLIHEAVHVWQEYCDGIGEHSPGAEQEAYAVQAIAQELMAEFARRMGVRG